MMKVRPKVLVTGPSSGGLFPWFCIRWAVKLAGGVPYRYTPEYRLNPIEFDALILSGGSDIHPKRYDQLSVVNTVYDEDRDQMELDLIEQAVQKNLPILGICRGMELLNIYFGGSLHQELSQIFDDFLPATSTLGKIIARHRIRIEKESKLYSIMKRASCKVNSLHHQGVNEPGKDLIVSARLKNGVIQAIEHRQKYWVLGVQWHPEYLPHRRSQRRIFQELVKRALQRREQN